MIENILHKLDALYGTEKETFEYKQDWQLLVSIILSAQTTDRQVSCVLPRLFGQYPTVDSLASAEEIPVMECIQPVGLHKSKAKNIIACCKKLREEYGGTVPQEINALLTLPGVGRKTATLFLADAYDIPGVTVDTHVFRITRRMGWASGNTPAKVEKELEQVLPKEHWNRINFQLVEHGRSFCKARAAKCRQCPLEAWCPKLTV